MILLQSLQGFFIALDSGFKLTDVLCATFSESRLSLSVALFAFL
jgi:hypothetical protein